MQSRLLAPFRLAAAATVARRPTIAGAGGMLAPLRLWSEPVSRHWRPWPTKSVLSWNTDGQAAAALPGDEWKPSRAERELSGRWTITSVASAVMVNVKSGRCEFDDLIWPDTNCSTVWNYCDIPHHVRAKSRSFRCGHNKCQIRRNTPNQAGFRSCIVCYVRTCSYSTVG